MLDYIGIKDKKCIEVGVLHGHFSREILERSPAELVMVDPWVSQSKEIWPNDITNMPQENFNDVYAETKKKFEHLPNVKIIREFSYFAAPLFQDNSYDFIYIDAIHTFNSCFCDMLTWYHKVVPNGWICGHDYTGGFVGVRYAVEAFCQISGEKLEILTSEDWGSWGIQKLVASRTTSSGSGK
jgi:hypothetical protein